MINNSLINPYITSLRDKLRKLRVELLFLLNQWYYLKSQVYPEIKHRYRNVVGDLVYDLDDKKIAAKQMDIRVKEILDSINRNKTVSKKFIFNTFNMNFSNKTHINPVSDDYDLFDVITREYHSRSPYDCDVNLEYEIAQLYRQIVKRVHPDLNGENETFNKYWNNIQDSYQTNNIIRLRLFFKLICEDIPEGFGDIRAEEIFLKTQIHQLEKSINTEKQKILRVKSEEPFCYEDKIDDPKWVIYKRNMLNSEIKITEQLILRNQLLLKNIIEKSPNKISV